MSMNTLKRFWNDEQGVAAIEYAIIAAVIAIALIAIMISIGNRIKSKFNGVNNGLSAHTDYADS